MGVCSCSGPEGTVAAVGSGGPDSISVIFQHPKSASYIDKGGPPSLLCVYVRAPYIYILIAINPPLAMFASLLSSVYISLGFFFFIVPDPGMDGLVYDQGVV